MIREILTYPNRKLKVKSTNVEFFDKKLHTLLDDMKVTMRKNEGIGLAAIQIGIPKNVLIINLIHEDEIQRDENLVEIINPIMKEYKGSVISSEGCLSIPGVHEDTKRHESIIVEYCNRNGDIVKKSFDGLMAIAFQHELDHLNGHLFIEKLSYLKRKKFEKEWKKRLKKDK